MGACLSAPQDDVGLEEPLDLEGLPQGGKKLHPGRIQEVYRMGSTIGVGGFSKVKLVVHRKSRQEYACKVMALPPSTATSAEERMLRRDTLRELGAMLDLDHPHVLGMREYFVQGGHVYMIVELMQGGQLLDRINTRGPYKEEEACGIFRQLIEAIQYLHSKGVVHRDIKLENLLLPDRVGTIKLADFGIAYKAASPEAMHSMKAVCGTSQYMAPEVLAAGVHQLPDGSTRVNTYGPACDLWSCGIILYMLLSGQSPFWSDSHEQLVAAVRAGDYSFKGSTWRHVSADAKDLVSKLLVVDPARRLTCAQVLAHSWMLKCAKHMQPGMAGVAPGAVAPVAEPERQVRSRDCSQRGRKVNPEPCLQLALHGDGGADSIAAAHARGGSIILETRSTDAGESP